MGFNRARWTPVRETSGPPQVCPEDAILSVSMFLGPKGNRDNPAGIMLSWFDADDGRQVGNAVIELSVQGGWYLGPPAAGGTRQWLAIATRQQPTRRQIVEAIRVGDAQTSN